MALGLHHDSKTRNFVYLINCTHILLFICVLVHFSLIHFLFLSVVHLFGYIWLLPATTGYLYKVSNNRVQVESSYCHLNCFPSFFYLMYYLAIKSVLYLDPCIRVFSACVEISGNVVQSHMLLYGVVRLVLIC